MMKLCYLMDWRNGYNSSHHNNKQTLFTNNGKHCKWWSVNSTSMASFNILSLLTDNAWALIGHVKFILSISISRSLSACFNLPSKWDQMDCIKQFSSMFGRVTVSLCNCWWSKWAACLTIFLIVRTWLHTVCSNIDDCNNSRGVKYS